ncbi:DUF2970 domain-containing protein [Roseateles sp. DC23W]|uniref:DUF2970 domain-containing protein n=1 Tax=Pelomonas dachongensis TaxID=3299029 RepID=A0ABW7EMZ1_9BURK
MTEPGQDLKEAVRRPASLRQTISAVAWSFFGVRRGRDHENDMARLNPVHVIIAGVLGAAVFVLMLLLLVRWVISSGVAGA